MEVYLHEQHNQGQELHKDCDCFPGYQGKLQPLSELSKIIKKMQIKKILLQKIILHSYE